MGSKTIVLDRVQVPTLELKDAILRAKRGRTRTCLEMSDGRYSKRIGRGSTGTVRMPIGVYQMGVHWRHLAKTSETLNRPRAAAMRPSVKSP